MMFKDLTDQFTERIAYRFKLLGEPMRLRIIKSLHEGEKCVQELVDETNARQANISKHLKMLCDEGIIARRKDGLYVYYSISDKTLLTICDTMCNSLQVQLKNAEDSLHQK